MLLFSYVKIYNVLFIKTKYDSFTVILRSLNTFFPHQVFPSLIKIQNKQTPECTLSASLPNWRFFFLQSSCKKKCLSTTRQYPSTSLRLPKILGQMCYLLRPPHACRSHFSLQSSPRCCSGFWQGHRGKTPSPDLRLNWDQRPNSAAKE